MQSINTCSKNVLAGEAGCRVLYCGHCRVVEIEIGALSLRLQPESLMGLATVLATAAASLDGNAAAQGDARREIRHVH